MNTPSPNLAIIVVIRDGWEEFAKECLESILATKPPGSCLFVVNNGSNQETSEAISDFCPGKATVCAVWDGKSGFATLSLAAAWNEGIQVAKMSGFDTFAIVNSDTTFHSGALEKAHHDFNKYGSFLLSMTDYGRQDEKGNDCDQIHFNAFLIGNRTIEALRSAGDPQEGLFDPGFKVACFEDNDYHMRIKVYLGAHFCRVAQGAYFNHLGSGTQKIHPVPKEAAEANMAYYKSKWGGPPGEEMFVPNLMREYRAILTMKMIKEIP